MPKITIDDQVIDCRDHIPVVQAALEAGWDVPHYCYHPALSVVASCRLCLMEMQMPNPKTGEMAWSPKLVPSCQTPVKDGMVVRFRSDKVDANREATMEAYLLNHPLDCPVCDQAGECELQDYSFRFGKPVSQMVDIKTVMPKKDIGPKTLLYSDRCVFCSRCVRFTDEISGTHELSLVSRAGRSEIDVFPGLPLDNLMQGNVVDICPVGALLDKDFLFKERVWNLKRTNSICPGCSTGCAIHVDSAEEQVKRLKPRFNPGVNDYWMCDEGRFGFHYLHDGKRLTQAVVKRGMEAQSPAWEQLPSLLRMRLQASTESDQGQKVAVVLSPMMACEEAWLVTKFIRDGAPKASFFLGFVPTQGQEQHFPMGTEANGKAPKFTIRTEKCPNRRGIETVLKGVCGEVREFSDFTQRTLAGEFETAWISGGYPGEWVTKEWSGCLGKLSLVIAHDLCPSLLTEAATIIIPACGFAEREGSFMNHAGLLQPFRRAIAPPDGCKRDGQFFFELAGMTGLYNAAKVREMMGKEIKDFPAAVEPPEIPEHQH